MPAGKHAVWPSVAVWDANTIAALATSNYQGDGGSVFHEGHVMRDLEVNSSDIVNYPIFIGHTGICNLRLGVGKMQIIFISPARLRMENCIPVDKELKRKRCFYLS